MKNVAMIIASMALIAAGVTVGALISSPDASAQEESGPESPPETGEESRIEELDAVLQELVADGVITESQADAVASALRDAGFGHFHRGLPKLDLGQFDRLRSHIGLRLEAAAETLGLTEDELVEALSDGLTLAEIAEERDVARDDLVAALVAPVEERIDAAVAEGDLTPEEADEKKVQAAERIERLIDGGFQILRGEFPSFEGRFPGPGFDFRDWFPEDFRFRFRDQLREGLPEGLGIPEELRAELDRFLSELPDELDSLFRRLEQDAAA